jgi:FAD/FMN-containing dehydrogenase
MPLLDAEALADSFPVARPASDLDQRLVYGCPAVLRPASVRDVQEIVARAYCHGLAVDVRSAGRSTFGQAPQTADVIIDTGSLSAVHEVTTDWIVVEAGALWRDIVLHTYAAGRIPELLPDSLDRSVGGFMATGGVSAAAHRFGLAVNNVLELEVVTADGKRVECSANNRADLFHAAVGGPEPNVIITRVTLPLAPWMSQVCTFSLNYSTLQDLLDAHCVAAIECRFDRLRSTITSAPDGNWLFMLQADQFFEPGCSPPHDPPIEAIARRALGIYLQEKSLKAWLFRGIGASSNPGFSSQPPASCEVAFRAEMAEAVFAHMLGNLSPCDRAPVFVSLVAVPGYRTHRPTLFGESALHFAATLRGLSRTGDARESLEASSNAPGQSPQPERVSWQVERG